MSDSITIPAVVGIDIGEFFLDVGVFSATKCAASECNCASSAPTRQAKDSRWQELFMAAPDRRRVPHPGPVERRAEFQAPQEGICVMYRER
jgi:hypothetical protein